MGEQREMAGKPRAPRNRTLTIGADEVELLRGRLKTVSAPVSLADVIDSTIHGDMLEVVDCLPDGCVDLLCVDPPYNRYKTFNDRAFRATPDDAYEAWLERHFAKLVRLLKPTASVYVCCDWRSSPAVYRVLARRLIVQNRITWEREKGRGALRNWKNSSEDIWFATVSGEYTFNIEAVKLKRRVLAPYRDSSGAPKDWNEEAGQKYRLTSPSNLWTDLTVPFWSMPENTDHPTQKPEKLLAKLILASSNEGDFVFDPFLGSGTTSVVAKKLNRRYCGVEIDEAYCLLAEKRLMLADVDRSIQGYVGGVFWERNSEAGRSRDEGRD